MDGNGRSQQFGVPRRLTAGARCAAAVALSAAMAASQDVLEVQIQKALQAARAPLLAALHEPLVEQDAGHLGLLCLAALHDGVAADDPQLAPSLAKLAKLEATFTYGLSLRLLVLETDATFADRRAIAAADVKQLLRHRSGGGFGYTAGGGAWDLSNTQYAALGLRAAASLGVGPKREVWSALADAVMDAQGADGGCHYRPGELDATASMTAAGIGVLAICRQALAGAGRKIPELDRRIDKGWKWLDRRAAAVGDAKVPWSFYFHYGLERAGILCDVDKVGGEDWYRRGAQMFVALQKPNGGWLGAPPSGFHMPQSASAPADTAFAVLFLRRRFQKVAAPLTPARTIVLAALGEQSPAADVDSCVAGLVPRGVAAVAEILLALRSKVVPRRRAAARALAQIAATDFGIDPELDAERNAEALRKAELWYLKNR